MFNALRAILLASWRSFVIYRVPLMVSTLVFGSTYAVAQGLAARHIEERMAAVVLDVGLDPLQLQELAARANAGDAMAAEEMYQQMNALAEKLQSMPEADRAAYVDEQAGRIFSATVPVLALFAVVAFLILVLHLNVSFAVAVEDHHALVFALRRGLLMLPSQVAVAVSVLFLSGLWLVIPGLFLLDWQPADIDFPVEKLGSALIFLAIFGAMWLLPRWSLAPVLVLQGKGILNSVRQSWARTRGEWGVVFSTLFVTLLGMVAINLLAAEGIDRMVGLVSWPGLFLLAFAQQMLLAFLAMVLVMLAGVMPRSKRG